VRPFLAPLLIAATGVALLGVGVLIAVLGDLDDSTRAAADLVELRADAAHVALIAEDAARTGSAAEVEGAIASIEARSVAVPEVAANALDASVAGPLLEAIQAAWAELAQTARLRAQDQVGTAELIATSDATRDRVDALAEDGVLPP